MVSGNVGNDGIKLWGEIMKEIIRDMGIRIDALEKECRAFHRQNQLLIAQLTRDGVLIQKHEQQLEKLKTQHEDWK